MGTSPGDSSFVQLVCESLSGRVFEAKRSVTVPVLLRRGKNQRARDAWLTVRQISGGPVGLYPDPESMLLTSLDPDFVASLRHVEKHVPGAACTLWSVVEANKAPTRLEGRSASAAMAVALRELAAHRRLRLLRSHHDPRCAITGALDADDRLCSIDGYQSKLDLARVNDWRVVAPLVDRSRILKLENLPPVSYASDIDAAYRLSRRSNTVPQAFAALAAAVLLFLLFVIGRTDSQLDDQRELSRQQDLQTKSDELAELAGSLYRGEGPDGVGLLLAIASDELAMEAGGPATALQSASALGESFVRSYRPDSGVFSDLVVSENGQRAVVETRSPVSAGVLDLQTGELVAHLVEPVDANNLLAAGSGLILASAISADGTVAAASTADQEVHVRIGGVTRTLSLGFVRDVVRTTGGEIDRYSAAQLAIDRSNRWIYATTWGSRSLAVFDLLSDSKNPARVCDLDGSVGAIASVGADQVGLVLDDRRLLQFGARDCSVIVASEEDQGTRLVAVDYLEGTPMLAAVREGQLLAGRPGALVVVADGGSFSSPKLGRSNDGDLIVAAGTESGTVGWAMDGDVWLTLPAGGQAFPRGNLLFWLHDGILEQHSIRPQLGFLKTIYSPALDDFPVAEVAWSAGTKGLTVRSGEHLVHHSGDGSVQVFESPRPEMPSLLDMSVHPDGRFVATSWSGPQASDPVLLALVDLEAGSLREIDVDVRLAPLVQFASGRLFASTHDSSIVAFDLAANGLLSPASTLALTPPATAEAGSTFVAVAIEAADDGRIVVLATDLETDASFLRTYGADGGVGDEVELEWVGAPAPADLEVLSDGRLAVLHSGGRLQTFDDKLGELSTIDVDGGFAGVVLEIPNSNELLVTARNSAYWVDVDTGVITRPAMFGSQRWYAADLASDGRLLAIAGPNSLVIDVWSVDVGDLRERACRAVGRDLSPAEWEKYIGEILPRRQLCDEPAATETATGLVADLGDGTFSVDRFHRPQESSSCSGRRLAGDGVYALWLDPDDATLAAACVGDEVVALLGPDAHGADLNWSRSAVVAGAEGETSASELDVWWAIVEEAGRQDPALRLFSFEGSALTGTWLFEAPRVSAYSGRTASDQGGPSLAVATGDGGDHFMHFLVNPEGEPIELWRVQVSGDEVPRGRTLVEPADTGPVESPVGDQVHLNGELGAEIEMGDGISRDSIESIALTFEDRLPGACGEYWARDDWRTRFAATESAFRSGSRALRDLDQDGYDDFSNVGDVDGDGLDDGLTAFQCRLADSKALQGFLVVFADGLELTVVPDDVKPFLFDALDVDSARLIVPDSDPHVSPDGLVGLYWVVTYSDDLGREQRDLVATRFSWRKSSSSLMFVDASVELGGPFG